MAEKSPSTRRRLLQLSGATVAGILAGCSQSSGKKASTTTSSSTTSPTISSTIGTTNTTETTTGETTTEETSKSKLRTDYNSREKFGEPGTSFDDFEDASKWTAIQKTVTPDSSLSFNGTQSLKLSTDSSKAVVAERRLDSPLDISKHDVSFAFRTENPRNVAFIVSMLDPNGNRAVLELRRVTEQAPDVGWFRTCPGVWEVSDTHPDFSNIVRIKLILNCTRKDGVQAHVDDMRLSPKPEKGYAILSWDDGDQNYYDQGAPINDKHGFPAVITMPTVPGRNKEPFYMTLDEYHERQKKGDEVVIHGAVRVKKGGGTVNQEFGKISPKELTHILRRNKQWMIDNGLNGADFVVYPGNNYDKTALDIINKYCYMGGFNQSANVNTTGVYGFDPLVLPRTQGVHLDKSKRAVTLAAKYRQCTILNFHNFNSHNTMSRSDYKKLLTHIDTTKGIEVITFSDLWDMRRSQH